MKRLLYGFLCLSTVILMAESTVQKEETTVPGTDANVSQSNAEQKVLSATRGDVKIIEATENIRYLSQKIVKDYLYHYQYPEKKDVKKKLFALLGKLNSDFRIIATTTKDTDTKDILEFLAYSAGQMEEIFGENPDEEKAALMLDYSETLLEGADSIADAHKYDFSKEEKMLMVTKKIEYLLERVGKYYMAMHVGFNTPTITEQLQQATLKLEENIALIDAYSYPAETQKSKELFLYAWGNSKMYLDASEKLFIPTLISLAIGDIEHSVAKLAIYHSKNQ